MYQRTNGVYPPPTGTPFMPNPQVGGLTPFINPQVAPQFADPAPPVNPQLVGPAPHVNPPVNPQLVEYINPNVQNTRVKNAIDVHVHGVQRKPCQQDTYKTVMCRAWLASRYCRFEGRCRFAHGLEELRAAPNQDVDPAKYKSRLCDKYTLEGICPYGSRCLFIHPGIDMPFEQCLHLMPFMSVEQVMPLEPVMPVEPEFVAAVDLVAMEDPVPSPPPMATVFTPTSSDRMSTTSTASSFYSILSTHPGGPAQKSPFIKSGPSRQLLTRPAVNGTPMQPASVGEKAPLLFNQTAEAMVAFLWDSEEHENRECSVCLILAI